MTTIYDPYLNLGYSLQNFITEEQRLYPSKLAWWIRENIADIMKAKTEDDEFQATEYPIMSYTLLA